MKSLKLTSYDQYYKLLYLYHAELVFIINLQEEIVGANQNLIKYGFSIDDILHKHIKTILQVDFSISHEDRMASQLTFKNGDKVDVEVQVIPIVEKGELKGYFLVVENQNEIIKLLPQVKKDSLVKKEWITAFELQYAFEQKQFTLFYQPKLSLTTGKIVGVEALIRWNHPKKGMISPGEFIPITEETGLIIPIGEWTIREACRQNKAWQKEGHPPMLMSVNLSVRQLHQPDFVEVVRQVLVETELAASYLELEITESMLMDHEKSIPVLRDLKKLGVQISLDDFGTGYSSLHYFKNIPIDRLKIDQSFVRNCSVDTNDATIVKTIIAMAHQLKLEVIAEGVEIKEHLLFLQRNVCDEAQGYLFSKPLPPEELICIIKDVEQVIPTSGLPKDLTNQHWIEEANSVDRQELIDTISKQQGMIMKFIKKGNAFIHTLCGGELIYKFGLIPEQIIGKELKDFLEKELVNEKLPYYERAWSGENVVYEAKLNDVSYITSLQPVKKIGQVVEVISSSFDITPRKKIEEELKLREANFRIITENMLDLVGVWDLDGNVIYASPSHKKVLGFNPEDYKGKQGYNWVHPEDIPILDKHFENVLNAKQQSPVIFRAKHNNGGWVKIEVQVAPVMEESGTVKQFVVVGRDVNNRK